MCQKIANELSREARENIATAASTSVSTEVPVIFIHIGLQPYVEAAIRGTAYWHKPVIVLGDAQSMASLSQIDGVEFVDIATYRSDPILERARNVYVHRSTNPMQFESFCFERVLILKRFLIDRKLDRAFHLDSDAVLLQPLSRFPFHLHRVWLVNNDFYHEYGFSPVPSASIHAALLDVEFCEQFERLYFELFENGGSNLPSFVSEIMKWADERSGKASVSDMLLYFLLQKRTDEWSDKCLGWLADEVGDLGRQWKAEDDGMLLTFVNNLGTAEGPEAVKQYAFDRTCYLMAMDKDPIERRVLVEDVTSGAKVQLMAAHFSGGAKRHLTREWLASVGVK